MAIRGMARTLDRSPGMRLLVEWSTMQDSTPAPRAETAATLSARGYLPFRIGPGGALVPAEWQALLAERKLTNLVLLKADDPLAVETSQAAGAA